MNALTSEEPELKNQQQQSTPSDRKLLSLINRRRSPGSSSTSGDFSPAESQLDEEQNEQQDNDDASRETRRHSAEDNQLRTGNGGEMATCGGTPEYSKSNDAQRTLEGSPLLNHEHRQQQQQQHKVEIGKGFEEVKQVELFGVRIVALTINGKERLCLAQISNTLLKEFSYNEIHNRRVALGITCIQCTPIQLEMLRRAGAMPSSSRRCGMITMREAERLCRSFLVEEQTPELPDNFYFTVAHRVNYGCKGRFIPARYISSRAKCIECFYCGEFYSPNKFIFHSHRQPHVSDCNPPDSPNINSWRKHIDLDWTLEHSQEIKYAWEDVKSLFNGGTRRRAPLNSSNGNNSATGGSGAQQGTGNSNSNRVGSFREPRQVAEQLHTGTNDDQLIDVECDSLPSSSTVASEGEPHDFKMLPTSNGNKRSLQPHWSIKAGDRYSARTTNSLMLNNSNNFNDSQKAGSGGNLTPTVPIKRMTGAQHHQQPANKRFASLVQNNNSSPTEVPLGINKRPISYRATSPLPMNPTTALPPSASSAHSFGDFLNLANPQHRHQPATSAAAAASIDPSLAGGGRKPLNFVYPLANSSNFIYSQLYNQLMQPQQVAQQQQQHQQQQQQQQQQTSLSVNAQLALRHHLWSSLLANLQCNTGNQTYSMAQQSSELGHCNTPIGVDSAVDLHSSNLNHLISAQLYSAQTNKVVPPPPPNSGTMDVYKVNSQNSAYSLHKYPPPGETNDL